MLCCVNILSARSGSYDRARQSQVLWYMASLRPSDAYIFVEDLTIIDSDNDLSPDRSQATIWIEADILLIGPLGTKFS